MEVDDSTWPALLLPGEPDQPNTTMPQLPLVPMHLTLCECITVYPMIPKGAHYSPVDNTVHIGAAAVAAQHNKALLRCHSTLQHHVAH
jgi:hypothetical protein